MHPNRDLCMKLNCNRLKWDHHGDHEEAIEYAKVFTLCPLNSVHELVHLVRCHAMVERMHDRVQYKSAVRDRLRTCTEHHNDMFYVCIFFRNEDVHFKGNG